MNSYSQNGEDLLVQPLLPEKGIFVDVGAGDGKFLSNTLMFEEMGWKGLLIEPDPRRDLSWRKAPLARLNGVPLAASGMEGTMRFFQHPAPDLSRESPHGNIEVPTMPLWKILDLYCIIKIDLLSLDTEGTELEIWRSCYIEPTILIIEWDTMGLPSNEPHIMSSIAGYELIHKTPFNLIFRRLP